VAERAKRIQEAKEAAAVARREAAKRQRELEENIKAAAIIFGVIAVAVSLFVFLMISVARAIGL
jgi:type IV secretory pathway component VirB8